MENLLKSITKIVLKMPLKQLEALFSLPETGEWISIPQLTDEYIILSNYQPFHNDNIVLKLVQLDMQKKTVRLTALGKIVKSHMDNYV